MQCREAMAHPGRVQLSDELRGAHDAYKQFGAVDAAHAPNPLAKGPRFDMPTPGMKAIVFADVMLTWLLCNVSI